MSEMKPDFDINEGAQGVMLPSLESVGHDLGIVNRVVNGIAGYASYFEEAIKGAGNAMSSMAKALQPTPQINSFARMTIMPDSVESNLLPWPGIAPESIMKIARENIAPELIIAMRVADVMRYSELSTHPWKPGWRIIPKTPKKEISTQEKKEIRAAERFITNSNIETADSDARLRDSKRLSNFQDFISGATRQTLTVDEIAIHTQMDNQDKVKAYALMPASRIRLAAPGGYLGDPTKFACAVDEGGTVRYAFTRDQLVFYRRNVGEEIERYGYGWPEIERTTRLIQGFQNAIDLNCSTFDRNSIPNGILVMSGDTVTQKQLDLLNRLWTNMKKGITKAWALPVIGLAGKDSKLEVLNLNDLKGMEVFYQDFMNMIAGMFCTIYQFPVHRLGYRISGKSKDSDPAPDNSDANLDREDAGLAPLLTHLECVINEYLIWSNWPDLKFAFTAKTPHESAREYEAVRMARTWGEERIEANLPNLEDLAGSDAKLKKIAKVMSMAPVDPGKEGTFQALASALFAPPKPAGEGGKGPPMTGKKDPAKSENHGGTAGVRRNSRQEKKKP